MITASRPQVAPTWDGWCYGIKVTRGDYTRGAHVHFQDRPTVDDVVRNGWALKAYLDDITAEEAPHWQAAMKGLAQKVRDAALFGDAAER